jgi:hypothetical protein
MPTEGVSGAAVAALAAGGILAWSGIRGFSISTSVKEILSGKDPRNQQVAAPVTPSGLLQGLLPGPLASLLGVSGGSPGGSASTPAGANSSANVLNSGLAKSVAASFGWTGSQFNSLTQILMHESGGNPKAKNPSSGALGVAQALGHGNANTGGSLGNQYGGYGLSDAQARAANSGNAYWQFQWMMHYIKSTYGSPNAAWAFWQTHNAY